MEKEQSFEDKLAELEKIVRLMMLLKNIQKQ